MRKIRCACGEMMKQLEVGFHCPACNIATAIAWIDGLDTYVEE